MWKDTVSEVLLRILNNLSTHDILNCCQVCWRWNYLASDNLIWYKRCLSQGICDGMSFENKKDFWKYQYLSHVRCCLKWRELAPVAQVTLPVDDGAVVTDLVMHHDWTACSLNVGIIVVVDLISNIKRHIFRLNGQSSVWALVAFSINNEDFLASGGSDGAVCIWNISTGSFDSRLDDKEVVVNTVIRSRMVRCLAVSETESSGDSAKLVSGGRQCVLLVWDLSSKKCIYVLTGHTGSVRCVKANTRVIVSASYDCTVIVWAMVTGQCMHVLRDHTDRVYTLFLSSRIVLSSSLDMTVKVWDVTSGVCIHTLMGHASLTKEVAMDSSESRIVSGNADHSIKVWRVDTGLCVYTVDGHAAALTGVHVVLNKFVVSAAANGTVKLWRLHDGSFVRDLLSLDFPGAIVWKIVAIDTRLICAAGSTAPPLRTELYIFDFSLEPPQ